MIQYLQEKWGAAEMGHFLAPLEPKEEESSKEPPIKVEANPNTNTDNLNNKNR
jgi:hypothetical protein